MIIISVNYDYQIRINSLKFTNSKKIASVLYFSPRQPFDFLVSPSILCNCKSYHHSGDNANSKLRIKYIFRSINFDTNLNPQTEFHLDFSLENDIVPEKPWSPGSMYVKKSKNPLFEWTYFHNWIEKLPSYLAE